MGFEKYTKPKQTRRNTKPIIRVSNTKEDSRVLLVSTGVLQMLGIDDLQAADRKARRVSLFVDKLQRRIGIRRDESGDHLVTTSSQISATALVKELRVKTGVAYSVTPVAKMATFHYTVDEKSNGSDHEADDE